MLRRLMIRDFVIVDALDIELASGFTVLTGETGAGKSILIDALQLALGSRGDAGMVREAAQRADISAEFDTPDALLTWLTEAGFSDEDPAPLPPLLLRRSIDTQGRSRAWINGHSATLAQLKEVAEHVLDIHGQHAWQGLTRPAAVRGLIDHLAGVNSTHLRTQWQALRAAQQALEQAQTQQDALTREREGLAWQVSELRTLAPKEGEWEELDAQHRRISHAQSLIESTQTALQWLSDHDASAHALMGRSIARLGDASRHDERLQSTLDTLLSAQSLTQEAIHELQNYLDHAEADPAELQALETRLSAWMGLARRFRRAPADLFALWQQWEQELSQLEQSANLEALEAQLATAQKNYTAAAKEATGLRLACAPLLAQQVTAAMQTLGMTGGRFEVAFEPEAQPQAHGQESAQFLVAGHAGSSPRPLAKVASGGELSRLALAIGTTTAQANPEGAATLIFDEIDSGVGGVVADTVGRLMKRLGMNRQVLAVTHLAQVAACADHHFVVAKGLHSHENQGSPVTRSEIKAMEGPPRIAEIARMLGGDHLGTSLAHAEQLLSSGKVSTDVTP